MGNPPNRLTPLCRLTLHPDQLLCKWLDRGSPTASHAAVNFTLTSSQGYPASNSIMATSQKSSQGRDLTRLVDQEPIPSSLRHSVGKLIQNHTTYGNPLTSNQARIIARTVTRVPAVTFPDPTLSHPLLRVVQHVKKKSNVAGKVRPLISLNQQKPATRTWRPSLPGLPCWNTDCAPVVYRRH